MALNDRLFTLLRKLESDDLDQVWERLNRKPKNDDFAQANQEQKAERISKRLRHVATHSIRNLFRGDHDYPWRAVLIQIAKKLKLNFGTQTTEEELEVLLWTQLNVNDEKALAAIVAKEAFVNGARFGPFGMLERLLLGPAYTELVRSVLYIIGLDRLRERVESAETS